MKIAKRHCLKQRLDCREISTWVRMFKQLSSRTICTSWNPWIFSTEDNKKQWFVAIKISNDFYPWEVLKRGHFNYQPCAYIQHSGPTQPTTRCWGTEVTIITKVESKMGSLIWNPTPSASIKSISDPFWLPVLSLGRSWSQLKNGEVGVS